MRLPCRKSLVRGRWQAVVLRKKTGYLPSPTKRAHAGHALGGAPCASRAHPLLLFLELLVALKWRLLRHCNDPSIQELQVEAHVGPHYPHLLAGVHRSLAVARPLALAPARGPPRGAPATPQLDGRVGGRSHPRRRTTRPRHHHRCAQLAQPLRSCSAMALSAIQRHSSAIQRHGHAQTWSWNGTSG